MVKYSDRHLFDRDDLKKVLDELNKDELPLRLNARDYELLTPVQRAIYNLRRERVLSWEELNRTAQV